MRREIGADRLVSSLHDAVGFRPERRGPDPRAVPAVAAIASREL